MELKLCPFCGNGCYVSWVQAYDWVVGCNGCMAVMQFLPDKESAILAWNNRHLTSSSSRAAEACPFCDCVAINEMGHCEGCGKLTRPPPA